ncbi:MAG: ATP-binding protein [Candidatus Eremiobacterota bacterium]
MIDSKIEELLDKFRSLPSETEWLEFKEAKNNFDFDNLGKYFSALSNEANLKEKQYGWLIFGVEDKKKKIVGTRYRPDRASLESLKFERTDLDPRTVILLDKVQKGQEISKEAFHLLKKNRLVEGRYPKIYITARIAAATGDTTEYIKYSAFDKQYYQDLIKKFLVKFKQAGRDDIDKLLMDKLPAHLNGSQKKYKINNLLNEMANKTGVIKNKGSRARPVWVLVEND